MQTNSFEAHGGPADVPVSLNIDKCFGAQLGKPAAAAVTMPMKALSAASTLNRLSKVFIADLRRRGP